MEENEISVTDTKIGGKFTGRDDNSLNFNSSYDRSAYLEDLYDKFQKEKAENKELQEFSEELDYFNSIIGEGHY